MRKPLIVIAVATVAALLCGCNARPISVREVDESVLPAAAKSLLSRDSQVTKVYEETYQGGTTLYNIHYTNNGQDHAMKFNPKDVAQAHGVFESLRQNSK